MFTRAVVSTLLVAIAAVGAASSQGRPPKKPSRPRVEIVFLGWIKTHGSLMAEFRIRNLGRRALYFYGYDGTSPLYGFEKKTPKGWKVHPLGWCGTGLGIRTMRPGADFSVKVHAAGELRTAGFRLTLSLGFDSEKIKHVVRSGLVRR